MLSRRRITIVNRYVWPDQFLSNDLAQWLAEAGYEVELIGSQPSYNPELDFPRQPRREVWNGVHIVRLPLLRERRGTIRQLNNVLFMFMSAAIILFGRRRDIVWTSSTPPVLQPFLLRIATKVRGSKLVYYLQDIYPEIALLMQLVKPGWFTRLVSNVDNWNLAKADLVVTLSEDMANSIRSRAQPRALSVINNFSAVEPDAGLIDRPSTMPRRFVFAGNLGRFQYLERLVEVFLKVDPSVACLELLGEGRVRASLEDMVRRAKGSNVRFHAFRPAKDAFDFISRCDFGIISLAPGLYAYAYPSKTFTYLAAGIPLLCFIEKESELAQSIVQRDLGAVMEWGGEIDDIVSAIEELVHNIKLGPQDVQSRSRDMFERNVARSKWLSLFNALQRT